MCGGRGGAGIQEKAMDSSRGGEDEKGKTSPVAWKGQGEKYREKRTISSGLSEQEKS